MKTENRNREPASGMGAGSFLPKSSLLGGGHEKAPPWGGGLRAAQHKGGAGGSRGIRESPLRLHHINGRRGASRCARKKAPPWGELSSEARLRGVPPQFSLPTSPPSGLRPPPPPGGGLNAAQHKGGAGGSRAGASPAPTARPEQNRRGDPCGRPRKGGPLVGG